MKLPEQYKNLNIEERRNVVINLISKYGNKEHQSLIDDLSDEHVEFLFKYFFTESKKEREKMLNDVQKKYEKMMNEIKNISKRLDDINLKYSELLKKSDDNNDLNRLDKKIQKV